MLTIVYQSRFKKDAKRYANNKKAQEVILETISLLQTGEVLPPKYKEHPLIGNYIGYLECHG
ncbi:type II toxin-antitoxin system YafQ family toxin, partial [Xenorhabdus bovienii]